jgi:transcriptional regulator of heat shock response
MLEMRRELILKLIVEDYIQSAEPVGSKQLGDRHGLDISPATIRNEMALLEHEGYLRQPHTSAGRIPTEKAYVYYLQHVVEPIQAVSTTHEFSTQVDQQDTVEHTLKTLAHELVDASGETAIVAYNPGWSYYTGVSNLFAKPDFGEMALLRSVSMWIDQFDEVLARLYNRIDAQRVVYIGSQNPFGDQMATILVKYQLGNQQEGIVGLVGPLRMDYARNIALVEEAKELIMGLYE